VPSDSPTSASASGPTANDAAARLKEIRARVADLSRRIQAERDPKAVAGLRAEVGKLTELLSQLIQSASDGSNAVSKSAPVVWPRDLSAESVRTNDWGTDPTEVAGG
jgi:hypothetical protein